MLAGLRARVRRYLERKEVDRGGLAFANLAAWRGDVVVGTVGRGETGSLGDGQLVGRLWEAVSCQMRRRESGWDGGGGGLVETG